MNRFERVVQILDNAIGGPDNGIGGPHGAFWQGLTRDQFVAMTVVGAQLLTVGQGRLPTWLDRSRVKPHSA